MLQFQTIFFLLGSENLVKLVIFPEYYSYSLKVFLCTKLRIRIAMRVWLGI